MNMQMRFSSPAPWHEYRSARDSQGRLRSCSLLVSHSDHTVQSPQPFSPEKNIYQLQKVSVSLHGKRVAS